MKTSMPLEKIYFSKQLPVIQYSRSLVVNLTADAPKLQSLCSLVEKFKAALNVSSRKPFFKNLKQYVFSHQKVHYQFFV